MYSAILFKALSVVVSSFSQIGTFVINTISFIGKLWEYPIQIAFGITVFISKAVQLIKQVTIAVNKRLQQLLLAILKVTITLAKNGKILFFNLIASLKKVVLANAYLFRYAGFGLLAAIIFLTSIVIGRQAYKRIDLAINPPGPIRIYDRNGVLLFTNYERKQNVDNHIYKRAPHAVDYAMEELKKNNVSEVFEKGGEVYTTIDLSLQNRVQQELLVSAVESNQYSDAEGSVLIIDSRSGEIYSLVGSLNYFANNNELENSKIKAISIKGEQLSLKDLAQEYASLLGNKKTVVGHIVRSVQDGRGNQIYENKQSNFQSFSDQAGRDLLKGLIASVDANVALSTINGAGNHQRLIVVSTNNDSASRVAENLTKSIESIKQAQTHNLRAEK